MTSHQACPQERTLADPAAFDEPVAQGEDCCFVQIYPPDVVDGMLRLDREVLSIGRDTSSQLCLADASVSRRHAELRRLGAGFEIVDVGSTNQTLVNGEPVSARLLRSGDCIKIGSFLFKFLSADSIETAYLETIYSALTIDALTGAFNKAYLLDNLQREIARSQRNGRPLAVVMADIDHFKSINDTFGHLVGDEVLREFGRRMKASCRDGDLFARYGGEEFCLVMPEVSASQAEGLADRYRSDIATTPFHTASGPLPVTASFGIEVVSGNQGATPETVIGAADERLYEAKHAGRNRVVAACSGGA